MTSWYKIWPIAQRLLFQNRWIHLILLLFPLAMAFVLLLPADPLAVEDVLSLLHQECLYGIALVAFTGGALLGNEQRSRRIIAVLSRAVSRRQYFTALLLATWLPLLGYVSSFVLSACFLLKDLNRPLRFVFLLGGLQLVAGIWTAAAALFFSTWLPMIWASTAAVGSVALLGNVAYLWPRFTPGHVLLLLAQGNLYAAAEQLQHPAGPLLLILGAALLFLAGAAIFEHRDLALKND
jgi:ABC-type transport system involved in multi-copper enzyme maturation permease subunit